MEKLRKELEVKGKSHERELAQTRKKAVAEAKDRPVRDTGFLEK